MTSANDLVLVQGMRETRGTLERWRAAPGPVLVEWFALSVLIAAGLLAAVCFVASRTPADPTPLHLPGYNAPVTAGSLFETLFRNSLVLALHATACVAGFIAGASMPLSAQSRSGFSRWFHEQAGRFAIVFVICVTTFSLVNQTLFLGSVGAALSASLHVSPGLLVLTLLPHAMIELTALFLPLAAWLIASRRNDWGSLLAATFVTVAIAVPMLICSDLLEAFLWPAVLRAVAS